jgi:hypothetical protein
MPWQETAILAERQGFARLVERENVELAIA